ncbi:unnamed protein product [Protopolystoma xenopodis]|uniref:Fibronectin type-III domain-containing protein n=1 Tax=Protopolystoma xenopodis TaxID=117903 RepID=A0A3S5AHL8_9PLAT|nr:unnamed protein product [Protopolystoma xenopodis]
MEAPADFICFMNSSQAPQINCTWSPPEVLTGRIAGYNLVYTALDPNQKSNSWYQKFLDGSIHVDEKTLSALLTRGLRFGPTYAITITATTLLDISGKASYTEVNMTSEGQSFKKFKLST